MNFGLYNLIDFSINLVVILDTYKQIEFEFNSKFIFLKVNFYG